jgi:hypothetical protein
VAVHARELLFYLRLELLLPHTPELLPPHVGDAQDLPGGYRLALCARLSSALADAPLGAVSSDDEEKAVVYAQKYLRDEALHQERCAAPVAHLRVASTFAATFSHV